MRQWRSRNGSAQDSCSSLGGLGTAEALWKGMLLLRLCPISMLTRWQCQSFGKSILALFASGSRRFRPTVCASSKYIPDALCRGPLRYVYRVVRLYDRRKARYATSLVHDRLITGGATSASCRALHFSVRSLKGREGVQGRRHASAARQFDGSELNWFKACAKLIMFYLATP